MNNERLAQKAQAEFEAVRKALAELRAQESDLQNNLTRLSIYLQFQRRGVTRALPVGFIAGGSEAGLN
jgi:hypothetical protein